MLKDYLSLKNVYSLFSFAGKCITTYLAIFAAANIGGASASSYSETQMPYRLKSGLACDGSEVFIPPYGEYTFNIPFEGAGDNCTVSSAMITYSTDYPGQGGVYLGTDVHGADPYDGSFYGFMTKDHPVKESVKKAKCQDWEPTFWARTERCSTTKDGKICSDALKHDQPIVKAVCTPS